jgi:hypothetical protein
VDRPERREALGADVELLARLAALSLLAVAGFLPATAGNAAPTSTICVGLILDAQSIGGSVDDACVNVSPGTTGVGVLEAAGHAVTYRQDGLICTIDSVPETGCSKIDNTHYWAYYHRAPDSTTWSYSVQDARTYRPANRSTEGWVFDNGSSLKPSSIPASEICAGLVKPTAAPTPKATHRASTRTHSPQPSSRAVVTPPPSPPPTKPPRKRKHSSSPTPTPSDVTATPLGDFTPAAAGANDTSSSSGGGSATGAIVAAGVIGVLAAATVVGARRRRRP